MASTPPLQITASPQTPATPLHGAAYDRNPVRQSSRIRQRTASHAASSAATNGAASTPRGKRSGITPESTDSALPPSHAAHSTPRKAVQCVQVVSPDSPNTEITPRKASKASTSHLQPFLSSTTTLSEGMLPTPVKTPKKKQVSNVKVASRALFQDPTAMDEMGVSSPRKGRKSKRYNGFSLESFRAEEGGAEGIQIFTDNRDKVPEADAGESNPFIDSPDGAHAKKLAGSSKRRKVSSEKPKDKQVQEAIDKDEGMVYVFRGKKVYRRFDDQGEDEEEEIDEEDLGLLSRTPGSAERLRPLRTLTRKSIKPTRLFQTDEQKAAREREKEEEATTDVEEHLSSDSSYAKRTTTTTRKRSRAAKEPAGEKKTSPFDQWTRGRKSQDGSTSKPAKRSATDAFDRGSPGAEVQPVPKRKARV